MELLPIVLFGLLLATLAVIAALLIQVQALIKDNNALSLELENTQKSPTQTQELKDFLQDLQSGVGFVRVHPMDVILRSPRDRA